MRTLLITIGHGAYPRGSFNALRIARSKAEAVTALRQRGVKRDDARRAVARAVLCGYTTIGDFSGVCELSNDSERAQNESWPSLNLTRTQREQFDRYSYAAGF